MHVVVVSVCLSVRVCVTLATSTRWQTFSVGNLHVREECNILFGLNDAFFRFCFGEKKGTHQHWHLIDRLVS